MNCARSRTPRPASVTRSRADPPASTIRVTSTRLVSLTQRSVAAIEYVVEAVDAPVRLVVQSELVANEPPPRADDDPRVAAVLASPLRSQDHYCDNARVESPSATGRSDWSRHCAPGASVAQWFPPARTRSALDAAGIAGLFDVRVDGVMVKEQHIAISRRRENSALNPARRS